MGPKQKGQGFFVDIALWFIVRSLCFCLSLARTEQEDLRFPKLQSHPPAFSRYRTRRPKSRERETEKNESCCLYLPGVIGPVQCNIGLKCQNTLPVSRRIFPAYQLTGVEPCFCSTSLSYQSPKRT
ncbi:hypothetical protein CEXT_580251 [Caerostris extrusa]|uniref:Secreted protein n=1 Tax=Caerostris extrusa TaxID=172846 RepID=A0AAV4SIM7_CAEEX|nr:hypothetical protein CEXT_580251 [Caerostris extrusa]